MKRITTLALAVLGLSIVAWLIAGPGHRFGLWTYGTGFLMMRWAAYGGIVAALLGLIPIVDALWRAKRLGALAAVVVGLAMVMTMLNMVNKARSLPFIHDISTDLNDPPQFSAIPTRDEADRFYTDAQHNALQQVYYPDISSVFTDKSVPQATQAFHDTLVAMGMDIAAYDAQAGHIEATDTTFWFGFKDDIVVRVRPAEGGSVVDIRSVSRVGRSDIGKNAERIRDIIARTVLD